MAQETRLTFMYFAFEEVGSSRLEPLYMLGESVCLEEGLMLHHADDPEQSDSIGSNGHSVHSIGVVLRILDPPVDH